VRRLGIVLVMLVATGGFLARAVKAEPTVPREPLERFPLHIADWSGTRAPDLEPAVLDAVGVDAYLNRVYTNPEGANVGLYLGFYASQRRGRTMHSPLNCLPGAGWQPLEHDRVEIPVDGLPDAAVVRSPITVNRYVVGKGLERVLVYYWYQAHGRVIASEYSARFFLVADALRLNRTDGALVRIITPLDPSAEGRAVSFIASMFAHLGRYLPA
jgi:EpsI family protein